MEPSQAPQPLNTLPVRDLIRRGPFVPNPRVIVVSIAGVFMLVIVCYFYLAYYRGTGVNKDSSEGMIPPVLVSRSTTTTPEMMEDLSQGYAQKMREIEQLRRSGGHTGPVDASVGMMQASTTQQ